MTRPRARPGPPACWPSYQPANSPAWPPIHWSPYGRPLPARLCRPLHPRHPPRPIAMDLVLRGRPPPATAPAPRTAPSHRIRHREEGTHKGRPDRDRSQPGRPAHNPETPSRRAAIRRAMTDATRSQQMAFRQPPPDIRRHDNCASRSRYVMRFCMGSRAPSVTASRLQPRAQAITQPAPPVEGRAWACARWTPEPAAGFGVVD